MAPLDALWGALVLTALAGLTAARGRWKRGQKVLPRVRTRLYLSIRSPDDRGNSEAPTELEPGDVEIIDTREQRDPPAPRLRDDFDDRDDRPTPPTRPRRGRR